MKIYSHRRNSKEELISTPTKFGVEIDIRSVGNDLILQHDPFTGGTLFTDWLVFPNILLTFGVIHLMETGAT